VTVIIIIIIIINDHCLRRQRAINGLPVIHR
jgi:hypothetical protein